jgi:hypothetical protein
VIEHDGDPEHSLITRSSDGQMLFLAKIFPNEAFGYWKVTVERPLRLNGTDPDRAYSPKELKSLRETAEQTVQIREDQTLEDLHHAIFEAFDRFDEHMYEFQFGNGPNDPKGKRYVLPDTFDPRGPNVVGNIVVDRLGQVHDGDPARARREPVLKQLEFVRRLERIVAADRYECIDVQGTKGVVYRPQRRRPLLVIQMRWMGDVLSGIRARRADEDSL